MEPEFVLLLSSLFNLCHLGKTIFIKSNEWPHVYGTVLIYFLLHMCWWPVLQQGSGAEDRCVASARMKTLTTIWCSSKWSWTAPTIFIYTIISLVTWAVLLSLFFIQYSISTTKAPYAPLIVSLMPYPSLLFFPPSPQPYFEGSTVSILPPGCIWEDCFLFILGVKLKLRYILSLFQFTVLESGGL